MNRTLTPRSSVLAVAALALLAFEASARAQDPPQGPSPPLQVAGDPEAPPPPPPPRREIVKDDGAGPRVTGGRAVTAHVADGFYGRIETEYFEVSGLGVAGVLLGLEGWGSTEGGGGGVPMSVFAGLRAPFSNGRKSPRFFATVGLGWDWAIYDRVRHIGGFGILAPFATGNAGIDLRGVRILGDVRAQYRWEWGASDRYQIRVGLSLSFYSELWDGPRG